ncbi:hypothetical protein CDL12_21879 [Handroanthus impetiginosus]|uniref:Uncharacterized protein n=1 Tax=Handroanthus impetiginosus TaxID=429701 RepID=A0A2G9GJY3_9LAMI|nr:hypothetical protein CDL12_21879 [Handroanthus impetiginosus]
MKETIFMRVLFCKIHCPFICFCKPTAAHLYTSKPFKLESTPSTAYAISDDVSDKSSSSEGINGKHEAESVLKSCIKKLPSRHEGVEKKRVQWTDSLGKELAEIKEFEPSETGDTDNEEESSRCLCVIL